MKAKFESADGMEASQWASMDAWTNHSLASASCVRNLQDLRHHGHSGGSDVELPQPGGLGRRTGIKKLAGDLAP